jgi:hypothetical protein
LARVAVSGQPESQTACEGASAAFHVIAVGTAPLEYQWRRKGVELVDGGGVSGARTAMLSVSPVSPGDAGAYSCEVRNADSSATSMTADLFVHDAPTIVDSSGRQFVRAGGRAEFSVTASGAGPLSYQWRRAGLPLSDGGSVQGATTDRLIIDPAQQSDAGAYDVIVSDGTCVSASAPAILTIISSVQPPVDSQHGEPIPSK